MTREEAIRHYRYGITHDIFSEPVTTYAKLSIEALEKQIPKKVVYHDNCGNATPYQARCPICYEAIEPTFYIRGESWCQYCGQKLDWTEEGE